MAAMKYKRSLNKKLNAERDASLSCLRKENAFLKKTLAELTLQHAQHYKLMENFLSLETLKLDSSVPAVEEQLCENEGNSVEGDSSLDKQACTNEDDVTELQNSLKDALEKNRQWLEYDQEREAYVRAVLERVLWLEKQLNEANLASSEQHNEEHSDEKHQMRQMQESYEKLLQKAREELEALREQADVTHQDLMITKNQCEEKQREVEELKQQLDSERSIRSVQDESCCSEDEDHPSNGSRDLWVRLEKEKRRTANVELQATLFQKFMLNRQFADQRKIEDLQRQIQISTQDCEDERQNCSYLKKQMVKVLKMLQKNKHHATKQPKSDRRASSSRDTEVSGANLTSTPRSDLLNETFLECPKCQAEYPASHYRELMVHIDVCLA